MKDTDGKSYVKVFNKLWAEMALVDSFYPSFWSIATYLSKQVWPLYFFPSVRHLFFFPHLPSFLSFPISLLGCWLGCCGSTSPRLLSGTNFKKLGWKKKNTEGEIWWEKEKERERGSSSSTEPLQLFKWPLSLCTCSLCLVWILKWPPPKRQISTRWSPRREQRLSVLDFFASLP